MKTTVRTIHDARWGTFTWRGMSNTVELRVLRVTGSGFLKNMVRCIAGTLVHIGNKKAPPELVEKLLATQERALAGPTAPARGLWLWDVKYKKT